MIFSLPENVYRHMNDKPFAGDVAPELLRNAPLRSPAGATALEDRKCCNITTFEVPFELERKEDRESLCRASSKSCVLARNQPLLSLKWLSLRPSLRRGEQRGDVEAWVGNRLIFLARYNVEVEGRVVIFHHWV